MSQLVSNARWLALAQFGKVGIQLVSMTVLARLLEPKYYGIMAVSQSVVVLASLFRNLGTTTALIQAQDVSEEMKQTAFWISVSMGGLLFFVLMLLAYPAAQYFREPVLTWVLMLMAVTFPVTAASAVHGTMLEREGRFQEVTFIEVSTQFLNLILSVALALGGAGIYSLAVPPVVTAFVASAYFVRQYRWKPKKGVSFAAVAGLAGFSANVTGFNLINYFSRNADTLIIGRVMGVVPLGIYSTAMKLMLFPLQSITYVSNRALFPVLSQAQSEPEVFKRLYLQTVSFVSLITFPMMAGLWVARHEFVLVAYGEKWLPMVGVVAWLAPVGLLQSVNSTTGTVFMAKGRAGLLFKVGVYSAILQVGAFLLGATKGIVEVAMLYFVANIVITLPSNYLVARMIDSSWMEMAKSLMPAAVATALMCVVCWIVQRALSGHVPAYGVLLGVIGAGVATYVASLFGLFPQSWRQVLSGFKRNRGAN